MFDTLFSQVTVVTMDAENRVLYGAYVGVSQGKITYVGEQPPAETALRVVKGPRRVLMPGLINAHTHVPMTALRGVSDDENLQDWLEKHIYPREDRWDSRAVYWTTQLGLADMMASGTTSFSDMYYFCDDIAKAVAQSGMKANLSRSMLLFTPELDWGSHQGARETRELVENWHNCDSGRILVDVSIHAEYTSHEKLWEKAAAYARENGLGMQVHLSETEREHNECVAKYGLTPAAVLNHSDLFGTRTTAAHCVWVTDDDMDILAARGVHAVHNPVSNLKLSSGVARVTELRKKGVNVALGTDSVASNNSHDLFEEIKLAAIGQKNRTRNPKVMAGGEALIMATRSGAQAQGRALETGCVAVGYDADLILLDFDKPHLWPCLDVISQLTYAVRGSDVCLTMVRGDILYRDGVFLTLDMERIRAELGGYVLPLLGLEDRL